MRPWMRRALLWMFTALAGLTWAMALVEWRRPGAILQGYDESGGYHYGDCDAGPQSRPCQLLRCWDAATMLAGLGVVGAACGGAALALSRRGRRRERSCASAPSGRLPPP